MKNDRRLTAHEFVREPIRFAQDLHAAPRTRSPKLYFHTLNLPTGKRTYHE